MTRFRCGLYFVACSIALGACDCSGTVVTGDGGGDGAAVTDMSADGSTSGDMSTSGDTSAAGDMSNDGGLIVLPDGAVLLPDGAVAPCAIAPCGGHTYACGDCIDNDGDGLIDSADPDCIGACSNNEAGYDLMIPGGDHTCMRDCFYDSNSGSGNDGCVWDLRCDPLEPDAIMCMFTGPGGSVHCPDPQDAMCATVCGPITPNGCDCFGCCELPALSGQYVFLGSRDASGAGTCTPDVVTDHSLCHPCTPVMNCLNPCDHCELCLGRTALPADCSTAPPADGGVAPDGSAPPPRCAGGVQPCGLPTDPVCPDGLFCLTGCCVVFG